MDVQDIHDFLAMRFDRFDADEELFCDLFVGGSFGDELEDFNFAGSESGSFSSKLASFHNLAVLGDKVFCDRRRNIGVAAVHLFNSTDQIWTSRLLENVSQSPRQKDLAYIFFVLMH